MSDQAMELSQLFRAGYTDAQMARYFEVGHWVIISWRKRDGLIRRSEPFRLMHGTEQRYSSQIDPCRCPECTDAHRLHSRDARSRRQSVTRRDGLPPGVEHGLSAYGNWGCRCPICSEAQKNRNSAYQKLLKERRAGS